jgi:hypothetical protein
MLISAMSEFSVVTSAVDEMSTRLGVISQDTTELHGQVGAHASAAAQTPLDGVLSGLMGNWAAALPHFGLSGERLQAAMSGAAAHYRAADAAVEGAAGGSESRS